MSPQGLVVDPFVFARDGAQVADRRAVEDFERLAVAVFSPQGEVEFSVIGSVDRGGRKWLAVAATGTLVLQCQRCLEAVEWRFAVDGRLMLVPQDQALPDEDLQEDDWDPLPVGERLGLLEVVEDEILLALPIAPRHDECSTPSGTDGKDSTSPFAALAGLRRSGKA